MKPEPAYTTVQIQVVPVLDLTTLDAQIAALKGACGSAIAPEPAVDEVQIESHFDRIEPQIGGLRETADGVVYEGRVARVHRPGDGLHYPGKPDQYRDATELARLVEKLPGTLVAAPPDKPIHHPGALLRDPKGVDTKTPHRVVGRILSAHVDGEYAVAEILITDPETLESIRDGHTHLSLGYWSIRDAAGYQRNTIVDHLSVVPYGRCTGPGGTCELTRALDAACGCQAPMPAAAQALPCACVTHAVSMPVQATGTPEDPKMDELQKKLDAALADASAMKAKADAAEQRTSQVEKERDEARLSAHEAKKDAATEKERADKAEKSAEDAKVQAHKDANEQFEARLDARVALLSEAQPILGKTLKVGDAEVALAKLDDRAIMSAVVKHVDSEDLSEKDSIDYVRGMYRSALKTSAKASGSRASVREAVQQSRMDAKPSRAKARAEEEASKAAMNKSLTGSAK